MLRSCEEEAVQDAIPPNRNRKGGRGRGWRAGGTRLSQLAPGLPLGTGPPSASLPPLPMRDFCHFIAPLSTTPLSFFFPTNFSFSPTPSAIYRQRSEQLIKKMLPVCVFLVLLCTTDDQKRKKENDSLFVTRCLRVMGYQLPK